MASQPYITNHHLDMYYAEHVPQPLEKQFYLVDLGGVNIERGKNTDLTNKHIIEIVTSQSKPVLFQNYKVDGTNVTNTIGTYETKATDGQTIYCWKTHEGTLMLRRLSATVERISYFPRNCIWTTVFPKREYGPMTNSQYAFGTTKEFDYYHNGCLVYAYDEYFYKVLKIDVCDTDEKWAKAQTSFTDTNRLEWEDHRNTWNSDETYNSYKLYLR